MFKPRLSLLRIVEMNVGFLGIQFSFGLQQANMGPIYSYLGANEAAMPLLWLAGPLTGLFIQPLVGAISDRTQTRFGRRTPYLLLGAILCTVCLIAMPYSRALWIAASLLWVLDSANNITMEPYRAYVGDRLDPSQHSLGFLMQSAFTGLSQTLAYLAPSILVYWGINKDAVDSNGIPNITHIAFLIGAGLSLVTMAWSVFRVPELPLAPEEVAVMHSRKLSLRSVIDDVRDAMVEMPETMRKLQLAMLFQWYAMFAYWQFIALALARSLHHTSDPASTGFRDAVLTVGQIGAFYNAVAFVAAFALVPVVRRWGPKNVHSVCLVLIGLAMIAIPGIGTAHWLFVPMIGVGIGWASMMGSTYVMVADAIPPERNGIYMGIFNMFLVIPMLLESLTMPLYYRPLLGGDPRNVLYLAGVLMIAGAAATVRIRQGGRRPVASIA